MICKKCGKENPNNSQVCYFCGENLSLVSNNNIQNNDLLIFGVPLTQNNNDEKINTNEPIKFDSPINNTVSNQVNVQPQNENNNLNRSVSSSIGSEIIFDSPKPINNNLAPNIDNNSSNVLTNDFTLGDNTNKEDNSNLSKLSDLKSIQTDKENNMAKVEPKKKKSGKGLFVVAALLIIIACVLVAIPIFYKSPNRIEQINNNSNLNVNSSGEIKGNIKLITNQDIKEYEVISSYSKGSNLYNAKFELNSDTSIMNLYMTVSNKYINMYLPSQFIDLFGDTNSSELKWIKYSIEFVNEIDIENYKLAELFDSDHFNYVNDVNDTKHYRLLLDDALFKTSNSNEYLYGNNLEIYADKDNFLSRFTTTINNIGSGKSSLDIDIKFSEGTNINTEIPNEILNTSLSLDEYLNDYKVLEQKDLQS